MQEIQLDKHVKLLDSPGIVMATGSGDPASVVLRNCIKVHLNIYVCIPSHTYCMHEYAHEPSTLFAN